jgi:hypothetical protein
MALTDNLVAYWALNESSGSREDVSGSGNTLGETAATVSGVSGKISQGANIVRSDLKWLRVATNASLQMGDIDFTIACWAKFTSFTATAGTLVDKDNGASWEYDFQVDSAGKLNLYLERGGAWANALHTTVLATGTWYFLVGIYDSVNDLIKLSVNNGTFQTTAFAGGTAVVTTSNFNIGNISGGDLTNACDGIVDEVGIWKRALTTSEITELYNGGAGLTYPFTTSYYIDHFDRANGSLGSNWVTASGGTGLKIIFTSKATATTGSTTCLSYYNASVANAQWSEVTVGTTPGSSASSVGPALRMTDSSNFYYAWIPLGVFEIWKCVGGSFSSVHTGNTTSVVATDVIRFEAEGTALRLYRNGGLVISTTDSSLTSGNIGLHSYTNDEATCGADVWRGGVLEVAAVTAYPAYYYTQLMQV